MVGRMVETESGRRIGRCRDMRAIAGRGSLKVTELVVGRRGRLEHFGIGTPRAQAPDAVPVGVRRPHRGQQDRRA